MSKVFKVDRHVRLKRDELVWALGLQDYNMRQIADVFNIPKATIQVIINRRPAGWKPKWVKMV